jgi:hypothetical protein
VVQKKELFTMCHQLRFESNAAHLNFSVVKKVKIRVKKIIRKTKTKKVTEHYTFGKIDCRKVS